jgi:hypothetical protein
MRGAAIVLVGIARTATAQPVVDAGSPDAVIAPDSDVVPVDAPVKTMQNYNHCLALHRAIYAQAQDAPDYERARLLLSMPICRHTPRVEPAAEQNDLPRVRRSYRLAVIAVDVASLAIGMTNPSAAPIGAAGLIFGAPIVHLLEGNSRSAGISLALRWGLGLVGAGIGWAITPSDPPCAANALLCFGPDFPRYLGAGVGATLGLGVAIVIDWRFLAVKDEAVLAGVAWIPTLHVTHDRAVMAVQGRF